MIKLFSILAVTLLASIIFSSTANAVDSFDAGRIIDNATFTKKASMTQSDIQNFLNSKVPKCNTNGIKPNNYSQQTFVCLKDYTEGGKTSAQIIYEAAQDYSINPQVLLVLLQKEQSLVTDTWPLDSQYRSATGYGCPDTSSCNTKYYGLTNQIRWSAKMFRAIMDNSPTWYTPYKLGNNYIKWHPDFWNDTTKVWENRCGGTTVNIQNNATRALYNYTPYQPNASSWNAGWGTGDECGSYGNRNFYLYFNSWFGSTYDPDLSWEVVSQNIYDESKARPMATDKLRKGERVFVSLKVKNTGRETWYKNGINPIRLGIDNPSDSQGIFCDKTWFSCNRVATITEDSIAPGAEGHFEFYLTMPDSIGEFRQYMTPLLENRAWMPNTNGFHTYAKTFDKFSWDWKSYGAWSDSAMTKGVDLSSIGANQTIYIALYAMNNSATPWVNNGIYPTQLGAYQPLDRSSILCTSTWSTCNRPALMQQAIVYPGQNATFLFTIKTPSQKGEYREYFKPVTEYKSWSMDDFNHLYIKVI